MQSAKVNPMLKSLLDKISEYPNIPKKKAKFEVNCCLTLKLECYLCFYDAEFY